MYISKLLGKQEQLLGASSKNYSMQEGKLSQSQGTSQQRHWQDVLTPQQIRGFAVGEFAGKVVESDTAFSHTKIDFFRNYSITCV
ncbi:hypothetical protein Aasi_1681 [Candidatus Amoebophilus asiaticus 5a2]|uniref:Uncharacterized protein n=1 Tax=Amoebophilus asiaticus (strain 5a2) TaxID=452471 RepID=C3L3T7_AMOA5|nr:hypothetical protein [Candidatus Amoebophilus asiaticus]ACP20978.1 hypothetical protein Aasi_1681 [Candidatus Amoebophilus asiaticus 5a2]